MVIYTCDKALSLPKRGVAKTVCDGNQKSEKIRGQCLSYLLDKVCLFIQRVIPHGVVVEKVKWPTNEFRRRMETKDTEFHVHKYYEMAYK